MPSTSFFEFIPLFVGAIFAAIGFFSLKSIFSLRKNAERVSGSVSAIEKYVKITRMNNTTSSTLVYRPIVSYLFEGEERTVKGLAVNQLRHRLGQKLEVLVHKGSGSEEFSAKINDSLNVIIGLVFLCIGLTGIVIGTTLETATLPKIFGVVGIVFGIGFVIDRAFQKLSVLMKSAKNSNEPREDVTLITTVQELEKEVVQHQKFGFFIAFIAFGAGVWVMHSGISQLSQEDYQLLLSEPFKLFETIRNEKPLLVAGIGAFFTLTGVYSFIYQSKHYAFLLRR